jgi:ATP-binding cassette subfamily B (MDR/TAP) protein 1
LINQSQLTSKFASDNFAFQGALGEKMSTILMSIGLFISSFVIAFYTGWLMTLVIFVCIPALGISGAYHIKFLK